MIQALRCLAPLTLLVLLGAVPTIAESEAAAREIAAVLDDFHAAASEADEERYFGHLAPHAVFLGTDGTERWTKVELRAFAHPYFARGQGWTYHPRDRHVALSTDGATAWFDEMLDNDSYGECRGTGVLQRHTDGWKIEQYHLTIPIPNDLAKELVGRIRESGSGGE